MSTAPSLFNSADETYNDAGLAAETYLEPLARAAYAAERARGTSHRITMARVTRIPVPELPFAADPDEAATVWDQIVADIGLSAILGLK